MTQKNYLSNTKAITIKVLSKQETVILSKKMPKAAIAIEKHLAKKKKKVHCLPLSLHHKPGASTCNPEHCSRHQDIKSLP